MLRRLSSFTLAVLASAAAYAATYNTTLTVNASGPFGGTSITVTGTATLTNINGGTATGDFTGTLSLASTSGAPFTITLRSGATGTITGTMTVDLSQVATGTATAKATLTGGTGDFADASGTFNLAGTGSLGASGTGATIAVNFKGDGTITTGGSGGGTTPPPATGPTITQVLDAGSYTPRIAQGSIFVVKGSNLSASGYTALSFPLPQSSSGVKITFTPLTGGTPTDAYLIYLYNQGGVNQLAAVLPSTVAPGTYNVTVTSGSSTSAPAQVQVVQRKPALITADATGSGLAVLQNFNSATQYDIDRFTTFASGGYTFSPTKPGPSQVLVAWGVGLGPVTGSENTASPGFDFSKAVDVKVLVGNKSITPLYAGRAPGLAGADQINFQLPADVQTGCTVPFQISVAGQLSNTTFIAIAPDGNSSACVQPGFTTQQLQELDNGASRTIGAFTITQFTINTPQGSGKTAAASGGFTKYTGYQLAALSQQQVQVTNSGACTVTHAQSGSGSAVIGGTVTALDAGTVTLNGPSGSGLTNQAMKKAADNYYALSFGTTAGGFTLPGDVNANLVAGPYTFAGAGNGADVGAFSVNLTLGNPLTVTGGLPTTVNRGNPRTLNWTGGNASDLVEIVGSSTTSTGSGTSQVSDSWTFICTTNAGAGTFTVPSSVLQQLPASQVISGVSTSSLTVGSATNPATFTAPLKAGGNIDTGVALAFTGTSGSVTFQ
jgi:uncharacterized protein (TIGR03437 family)